MALLTAGSIATAAGLVWKYWRIPVRFYLWYKAEETEPAEGQIWRQADFSPKDTKWKVIEVDEEQGIVIESVDADEELEEIMTWDNWAKVVKKRRMWCHDTNTSMEDIYFGEHSED